MKDIKNGLKHFSASEDTKEKIYGRIYNAVSEKSVRRVRLVPCLAAVLLVALMTTSVLAVPALRSFFVPGVGIVESDEETVAYRFLEEQVGKSGNEYRFGYLYGDEAYVYMSTDKDYRELETAPADTLKVELIEASGGSSALIKEKKYTYRLSFSGLDETALAEGIGFDGDVIRFEVEAAEYRQYSITYGGETLELTPMSADNSVFHYRLTKDADKYNRLHRLNGSFVDEEGNLHDAETIRVIGERRNEGIVYLESPIENKLVGFKCESFTVYSDYDEAVELTFPLPGEGETLSKVMTLEFADAATLQDVTVDLIRVGEGVDEFFPKGSLTVATTDVEVNGVIYTPRAGYGEDYWTYLEGFLEIVSANPHDMPELPVMAPRWTYPNVDGKHAITTHYISDGRNVIELRFGYEAEYPCDITLEFDS